MKSAVRQRFEFMDFYFGRSERMLALEAKAQLIAQSSAPVLIHGEPGTGKERLANHLHLLRRAGGCLIRLNLARAAFDGASPKEPMSGTTLMEALVGEPGATVLLKGIHNLSVGSQERLLTAIDQLKTFPLLISTATGLDRLVSSGRFLPELYRRLSAYRIQLPPLRRRRRDIPELFRRIMAEMKSGAGMPEMIADANTAKDLMTYSWPGNVRQLQNVARYCLLNPHSGDRVAGIAERLDSTTTPKEAKMRRTPRTREESLERQPRRREVKLVERPLVYHAGSN
jgi:DNA-binding NtrC family response regulator